MINLRRVSAPRPHIKQCVHQQTYIAELTDHSGVSASGGRKGAKGGMRPGRHSAGASFRVAKIRNS